MVLVQNIREQDINFFVLIHKFIFIIIKTLVVNNYITKVFGSNI